MTIGSNHQGSVKHAIGATIKYREGIEKLREAIIKNDALKKPVKTSELVASVGLPTSTMAHLITIGAVKEKQKEDGMGAGRMLSWVYEGTDTGVVDGKLVEAVLEEIRRVQREGAKKRRELDNIEAEAKQLEKGLKKLPTGKNGNIDSILTYIKDELDKNEKVPGYIRSSTVIVYNQIINVLEGLGDLREVIQKINL